MCMTCEKANKVEALTSPPPVCLLCYALTVMR